MIKIGLTGSIGMGKSETARIFSGFGIPVYDADKAVHKLYKKNQKGTEAIKKIFPILIKHSIYIYLCCISKNCILLN